MEARTLKLSDDRTLAYAEYGDPHGSPVFFFHGTPGSRLLPDDDIETIKRVGLRVILPERPGCGFSDYQPERSLTDWADDVAQLADALKLDRFGIIGVSGGSPYAIACAYKIPERLTKAAFVGGLASPEVFAEEPLPTLEEANTYAEGVIESFRNDPVGYISAALPDCPPDLRQYFADSFAEAFRGGIQGYARELMLLYALPWDIPLEKVKGEIHIWHGDMDENSPIRNAEYLSSRLPNATLHVLAGTGHILQPGQMETILRMFVE